MIESQYTQAIHKRLPPDVYKWKINDNFAGGVPDAFYRVLNEPSQKPLWVEYKLIKKLPAKNDTIIKPNLSQQQLMWLLQARQSGENAIVILGVESHDFDMRSPASFVLHDTYTWQKGITRKKLLDQYTAFDYNSLAKLIKKMIIGEYDQS